MTVVWAGDFPDPSLLRVGDRFYAFATQSGPWTVQVMTSTDLRSWTHLGDALAALPPWARVGRTWSPAVLTTLHGYVLYYATTLRRSGRQAIAVAVADAPAGPYVDVEGGPLVYQGLRGGSIDPQPFLDVDGTPYLAWKSDDNAVHGRASLWVQQLQPDGLGFAGRRVRVLRHAMPWESPLVEAPCLVEQAGRYHLLYSGGRWSSATYGVGHALGDSPTGPFTVTTISAPWLSGPHGPGGQAVVTDVAGRLHLAYHGWLDAVGYRNGGRRVLHVDPLDLSGAVPRLDV